MKHSKGKWKVSGELDELQVHTGTDRLETYQRIAIIVGNDDQPPNYELCEANAKLIASSPDLLEALNDLTKLCKEQGMYKQGEKFPQLSKALKAIKKATE